MKFLHISDIHLGCTRYQLETSPRDFFKAWFDVIVNHGIANNVDFVIMGGDFFHKKSVPPETMNHAMAGLSILKENDIPVITIEGNHDQRHSDSEFSWLRSLEQWGFLRLLEPQMVDGFPVYREWNANADDYNFGGFTDIGRARIFGSSWYGASANHAIPQLIDAIRENRREGAFHILLLHTDVEGHQTHPLPALSLVNLNALRAVTDYVALGHTHRAYAIDNWVFNPGSLEITNIEEYAENRGAWLVEVDDENVVKAQLVNEYRQRAFERIVFDVSSADDPESVRHGVLEKVARVEPPADDSDDSKKVIEITLRGRLGFAASQLDLRSLREDAMKMSKALHVRLKNHSVPVEYAVAADLDAEASRETLERRVIEDLILHDRRYQNQFQAMSEAVIGAKRMALGDESPEKIADFIAIKALETSSK